MSYAVCVSMYVVNNLPYGGRSRKLVIVRETEEEAQKLAEAFKAESRDHQHIIDVEVCPVRELKGIVPAFVRNWKQTIITEDTEEHSRHAQHVTAARKRLAAEPVTDSARRDSFQDDIDTALGRHQK
ncbi:MAG: hypothetical protein HYV13_03080 [Candidatus Doudnabacteria bacterium]|nr:hypothetical protein [Candidatus Doudnabacteria bacterium]